MSGLEGKKKNVNKNQLNSTVVQRATAIGRFKANKKFICPKFMSANQPTL